MKLRARLELEPIGNPRHRARAMPLASAGKKACGCWRRWIAQHYEAKEARAWKAYATGLLRGIYRGPAIPAPVGLSVVAIFPLPASHHRKRDPKPRGWHVKKPDFDNVLKATADALVDAGWLSDDACVAAGSFKLMTGAQGEPASLHVTLYTLEDMP